MKVLLLCLFAIIGRFLPAGSFYEFSFDTLEGSTLHTKDYAGSKVIIAVVGTNTNGRSLVHFLDSVQNSHANLRVIVVPTGEFGCPVSNQDLINLKGNASLTVTKPTLVTKNNGSLQHPLFRWLTNVSENSHFNMDVAAEGQLFIISDKGSLYAVCSQETERSLLLSLIDQSVEE